MSKFFIAVAAVCALLALRIGIDLVPWSAEAKHAAEMAKRLDITRAEYERSRDSLKSIGISQKGIDEGLVHLQRNLDQTTRATKIIRSTP